MEMLNSLLRKPAGMQYKRRDHPLCGSDNPLEGEIRRKQQKKSSAETDVLLPKALAYVPFGRKNRSQSESEPA